MSPFSYPLNHHDCYIWRGLLLSMPLGIGGTTHERISSDHANKRREPYALNDPFYNKANHHIYRQRV